MASNSEQVTAWRRRTKAKLVECFGGTCNKCLYSACQDAMDFHHLDPSTKSFGISKAIVNPRKWEMIVKEARKCIMLCNRCHTELHARLWKIEEIEIRYFSESIQKPEVESSVPCIVCGKRIGINRTCCSRACAAKRSFKIDWPEDHELLEMLQRESRSAVARKLGVSDAAIMKRQRKRGMLAV